MPIGTAALIASLIASGAGGALANRKSARTSTEDFTRTPVESPAFSPIRDLLLKTAQSRLSSPSALPPSFESMGISNINNTSNLIRQSLENRLTGQGLGGSPIAGNAEAMAEQNRGGNIIDFQNSLPLINRQLQDQDFSRALQLYSQQPMGVSGTGTQVGAGSPLAGAFGGIGSMLGLLMGQGQFDQNGQGITGLGPGSKYGWNIKR